MKELLSLPIAVCVFGAIAYGLYRLSSAVAARGRDEPGKHQPYACGEEMTPSGARLAYHAFFRLALVFGILHLATLVLSTLPRETTSYRVATAYVLGIGVSVLVLIQGEG